MDITLFIPTYNRPDFLLRALRYYQSVNFRGKISIGDSSDAFSAKQIKNSLSQFSDSLEINYRYLPGCNAAMAVKILTEEANTAYAACIGDDDFLVPSGIAKCVDFLNVHPEYVAAHGVGVTMSLHSIDAQSIQCTGYYAQPIISETTAVQRLVAHLTNYMVSLFSVHRIEVWRTLFRNTGDIKDKSFGSELLQCCLSVISGKIMQLDGLYLIRQDHGTRYILPNWFEWITSEAWYPSYCTFRDCLSEAIAYQDGITLEEAKLVVEKAFAVYLAQCIPRNTPNPHQWRSVAKQIPGARTIWHILQPFRNKYSLGSMLKPGSPYHKDFMPIYNILTQRKVDMFNGPKSC